MTEPTPAPEAPPSAGALLRAAREARGLSVDEVAGRLRLRPPFVEALERDDLAALGAGPYGRGQLRNYARLVGVDEARVAPPQSSTVHTPGPASTGTSGLRRPSLVKRPRSRWPMRLLTLAVLGAVGMLGVLWGYGRGPAPGGQPASPAPRAAALGPSTPRDTHQSVPDAAPQPPVVSSHETQTAINIPGLPAVTGPAPESGPAAQSSAAASTPAAELVLTFTGPCWVEVTDQTGARLLYRMARDGDRHVLRGTAPFAVTLGNAGAAHLTYNGAPFDKPEINRPVARLRVGD